MAADGQLPVREPGRFPRLIASFPRWPIAFRPSEFPLNLSDSRLGIFHCLLLVLPNTSSPFFFLRGILRSLPASLTASIFPRWLTGQVHTRTSKPVSNITFNPEKMSGSFPQFAIKVTFLFIPDYRNMKTLQEGPAGNSVINAEAIHSYIFQSSTIYKRINNKYGPI